MDARVIVPFAQIVPFATGPMKMYPLEFGEVGAHLEKEVVELQTRVPRMHPADAVEVGKKDPSVEEAFVELETGNRGIGESRIGKRPCQGRASAADSRREMNMTNLVDFMV